MGIKVVKNTIDLADNAEFARQLEIVAVVPSNFVILMENFSL